MEKELDCESGGSWTSPDILRLVLKQKVLVAKKGTAVWKIPRTYNRNAHHERATFKWTRLQAPPPTKFRRKLSALQRAAAPQ